MVSELPAKGGIVPKDPWAFVSSPWQPSGIFQWTNNFFPWLDPPNSALEPQFPLPRLS